MTVDISANKSISGIGGVKDIKITNNSVVTATVSNALTEYNKLYLSAIGGMFETISIENSTVTANGGYAAGIGTGHYGFSKNTTYYGEAGTVPSGTITIADSTVTAASINGAAIGTSPVWNAGSYKPQNVNVTISGDSHVVARSVNGAGLGGGMLKATVKDPDEVIINPGIGGWDNGSGGSIGTQSLLRTASVVGDSDTPPDVSNNVSATGQTLEVQTTDSGTPTILAESGVCAISSETVTTDTPIIQNTVKTAATQTIPIKVGDTLLADLHKGYKSVARTANAGTVTDGTSVSFDAISAGTYGMTYGGGSDPAPLINRNGEPTNGSTFRVAAEQINRDVTSNLVAVKNSEIDTVPTAPELDTLDKTSITLKRPTDGQTYEYSIDGGTTWQDGLTFDNLQPRTTYNIIRRVKTDDNSGLTAYIAANNESQKYIYARFNDVTETGDGNVTAVAIPARPATPTLTSTNVSVGTNTITMTGTNGVQYTCNNETKTCSGTPLWWVRIHSPPRCRAAIAAFLPPSAEIR